MFSWCWIVNQERVIIIGAMKFFTILISIFAFGIISIRSCQEFFRYYSNFFSNYGQITLHNVLLQSNINVEVQMSIAAPVPSVRFKLEKKFKLKIKWKFLQNDAGKITLVNRNVDNDLKNGNDLVYRITLVTQNPPPLVTAIYLNNQLICTGPPGKKNLKQ